ncbi:hypothetical protein QVD99_003144 [Batrachochytrium dendrobatidis]|nr:hypothetical protein O5D80_001693 [Batrachochytrium dendrobatidis]KAK5670462.1 hypothetical protein QVD99_003144 [Batrachochytrium dendrobatidis]
MNTNKHNMNSFGFDNQDWTVANGAQKLKHATPDSESKNMYGSKLLSISAATIQRAWKSYVQRKIFKVMKSDIYTAERSMSVDILKRLSPAEGKLLNDSVFHPRVRFRFGGISFPPKIMYKIFTKGMGVQYMSGYKLISPGTQAATDACVVMGQRAYQKRLMIDEQLGIHPIGRYYEVTDRMEFVQLMNSFDDHLPHNGGRNNGWRELIDTNFARQSLHYDRRIQARQSITGKNGLKSISKAAIARPGAVTGNLINNVSASMGPAQKSIVAEKDKDIEDDFGVLFEWANHLSSEDLRDYMLE